MFYKSVIVPITEYACSAWHTSLTKHDTDTLEIIQKRTMFVIFSGFKCHDALKTSRLLTLSIRRDLLCKAFYMDVSKPEHKLNYLLEKRHEHPYKLRPNHKFKIEIPHTKCFIKKQVYNAFTCKLSLSCVNIEPMPRINAIYKNKPAICTSRHAYFTTYILTSSCLL